MEKLKIFFKNLFYKTNNSVNQIEWGQLRKLEPVSHIFGYDRGKSINRYYIENYLKKYEQKIKGHVLEFGDDRYTKKYGGIKVTKSDVIHPVSGNEKATLITDLTTADNIPSNHFDSIICIQTLQFIFDLDAAMFHLKRILKPGGIIFTTFSGISHISRYDMERWGEYWRFTELSSEKLFSKYFKQNNISIQTYGNVLVATAYLHGLSSDELTRGELDYYDSDYQVFIMVRAKKEEIQ